LQPGIVQALGPVETRAKEPAAGKLVICRDVKSRRSGHDARGLLRPAAVDIRSGYRYYRHDQVEVATRIRRLRLLELSLSDAQQLAALVQLLDWVEEKAFDRMVIDLPPTSHALRLWDSPLNLRKYIALVKGGEKSTRAKKPGAPSTNGSDA